MAPQVRNLVSRLLPHRLKGLIPQVREDSRSKRIVFLIECLLNQNARDPGAAESPAVARKPLDLLLESGVGLVQMPCPEIACLGFERRRSPGQSLRQALEAEQPTSCCRHLATITAERIQTYLDQGYEVVAILGGNEQSPGCAVHATDVRGTSLTDRSGVFMQALAEALAQRGIHIPLRGMRDANPDLLEQDLRWLRMRLSEEKRPGNARGAHP
jgi:predicted secreted protein